MASVELVKQTPATRAVAITRSVANTALPPLRHHGTRSIRYSFRVLFGALRVSFPLAWRLVRWVACFDKEARMRSVKVGSAALNKQIEDAITLSRFIRFCLVVGLMVGIPVAAYVYAGDYGLYGLAAAMLLVLALYDARSKGMRITDALPRPTELSIESVNHALRAANILHTPKDDFDVNGTSIIPHGVGARMVNEGTVGSEIVFDLPPGINKSASNVVAARVNLAAHFGKGVEQISIEPVRGNAATVRMFIADSDPFATRSVSTPYLNEPRASIWDGSKIGFDMRGRQIVVDLIGENFIIAGLPGQGKSTFVRSLIAPAILDPYVDLLLMDFKGNRDFSDMAPLCAARPVLGDNEQALREAERLLADLCTTIDGRHEKMRSLPFDVCPEAKITPELARTADFRTVVVVIDELQNAISALRSSEGGRKRAEQFERDLSRVLRSGRALGVVVILSTQRPDSEDVPSSLRGLVSTKIALRCGDRASSNIILGQSASSMGYDASTLVEHDGRAIMNQGTGWWFLKGFETKPVHLADMVEKGKALRVEVGTMREESQRQADSIVDDVRAILSERDNLTPTELADELAKSSKHAGLTWQRMSKTLKDAGLRTSGEGRNKRYRLVDANAILG